MFTQINDDGATAEMFGEFFNLQAVADFCYGSADDVQQAGQEQDCSPPENPTDVSAPTSPSVDLTQEEMEDLFGGPELESAFELALPQDSMGDQDVATSSIDQTDNNASSSAPEPTFKLALPQVQPTAEVDLTSPSTVQMDTTAAPEPAFKLALPQVQPTVEVDLTSPSTVQMDETEAPGISQANSFTLPLPQMPVANGADGASQSIPQSDPNREPTTNSSKVSKKRKSHKNAPTAAPSSSVPSFPTSTPAVPPAVILPQMPQFPNGPGYPFMIPGNFPIMGMSSTQRPNFMGMPYPAHFANNFGAGQFNMNPTATSGGYANFQTPMAYPNQGATSMGPQQALNSAQNSQFAADTTSTHGVSLQAAKPTEPTATKASKAPKVSKASSAKTSKTQAAKSRKGQTPSQQQPASKKSAPAKSLPEMPQVAPAQPSMGMTGWESKHPAPQPPSMPLGPDQIMMITGIHPMHMPTGVEFVSKFPEYPGCAVRHTAVANLTTQEHELVLHTAARNIFLAGVETGVQRAIQQMINDIDANGNTLGLAPVDLPPKGPQRTKMLDSLEKKMKKYAKKWAALTHHEADHVIRPVQAL